MSEMSIEQYDAIENRLITQLKTDFVMVRKSRLYWLVGGVIAAAGILFGASYAGSAAAIKSDGVSAAIDRITFADEQYADKLVKMDARIDGLVDWNGTVNDWLHQAGGTNFPYYQGLAGDKKKWQKKVDQYGLRN